MYEPTDPNQIGKHSSPQRAGSSLSVQALLQTTMNWPPEFYVWRKQRLATSPVESSSSINLVDII